MKDSKKESVGKINPERITNLKKTITERINTYAKKKKRNKIGSIIVQYCIIIFSLATTVIIGWKIPNSDDETKSNILNAALLLSTLATGMNAFDKFFDYKTLWMAYNISIAELKLLLSKIENLECDSEKGITKTEFKDLFGKYELICENFTAIYKQVRSSSEE